MLIAQKIEEKLSIADAMTTQIENHLKEAKVLQQSILNKAFSGQLVTQDPSDEPASTLLTRIHATETSKKLSVKA